MIEFSLIDAIVAVVLALAILRGIWIGLLREGFSIAALAAGCLAVRALANPFGGWLNTVTDGQIGTAVAPWIGGTIVGFATVVGVGIAGRFVKSSARAAGLGWADRAGGAALGAAEGSVVAMILVAVAVLAIGRDHPAIREARSVAAYDSLRAALDENRDSLPAVAAPFTGETDSRP